MNKPFIAGFFIGLVAVIAFSYVTNLYNKNSEFVMMTMKTCEDKRINVFGDKETVLSKINDGKLKFNGHYFPIKSYTYESGDAFMIDERCYAERLYLKD